MLALQLAVVPPLLPLQLQFHGPDPARVVAVPEVQKFAVGAAENVLPLLTPHTPLIGVGGIWLKVAATT
jgi:hypothetical protein